MPRTFARVFVALVGATVLATGIGGAALALGRYGNDISWPQCGGAFPTKAGFGIVGVNGGVPFSQNACLAAEWQWALANKVAPAYYMNLANPGSSDPSGYGASAAAYALNYASSATGATNAVNHAWWIDVETANTWSSDVTVNSADIQGMVDYFHAKSLTVGVYSTSYQWGTITGKETLAVPNWVPGASSASQAASWCSTSHSFTGGLVALVQYPSGSYDGNAACY